MATSSRSILGTVSRARDCGPVYRQPDHEGRAGAEVGLELDAAAVAIDDRGTREREPLAE